jgi:hypothetical protein
MIRIQHVVASSTLLLLLACSSSTPSGSSGGTASDTAGTTGSSGTSGSTSTARTGETECKNAVGHCQAGQHCDDIGFNCQAGCITDNNCPAGKSCSKDGTCVGGSTASTGCTRMAGFDSVCDKDFGVAAGKAYRCEAGQTPPHVGCKSAVDQSTYPGGVCCPF